MSYSKKTYSRKGGGGAKGNPFDRMMKEQCNKPVAAKSAGIVGEEDGAHVLNSLIPIGASDFSY